MTILCDVDEVVADLFTEWLRRYNKAWDDCLQPREITDWDIAKFVRKECGEKIFNILREPGLYRNVRPIPGALEGITTLREAGHRVVFVTSCVVGSVDAKVDWLMDHEFLPREKTPVDFIAAKDKSLVKGHLLIDDGLHNKPHILFDQPHNRTVMHPHRATSWPGVLQEINRVTGGLLWIS